MTAAAIDALRAERAHVLELTASLADDEWALPSDCDGWRVQDVIAHMSAVFVAVSGGDTARADPPTDDAERNADAAVEERRYWSPSDVTAEYERTSEAGITALAALREPPMSDTVVPLGNLGEHPLHLLADALVLEGPGGGTWHLAPGAPFVTVDHGPAADAAAVVTSNAHDFVSWGTTRRPWRDLGVQVAGDERYAAQVLDAINVI